jgi:sporulation protein YabP
MEKLSTKNIEKPNSIVLNNRSSIILTGISEIISSNDKQLLLKTNNSHLTISGSEINITKLIVDTGDLEATGVFDSIVYSGGTKKNFFQRLFK